MASVQQRGLECLLGSYHHQRAGHLAAASRPALQERGVGAAVQASVAAMCVVFEAEEQGLELGRRVHCQPVARAISIDCMYKIF